MRVAVVGGGITGLAAAYELVQSGGDVIVFEATDHLGGKIRTTPFAGRQVDEGSDAFLARVPAGVDLCRELGLDADLVSPATGAASVWTGGRLRRLPAGLVLGVPTDLDALAESGVVSPAGVARAAADLDRERDDRPSGDESVGALVRRRLGDEVHERLVDPLIGSINAGDTDRLSLRATAPVLAAAADASPSLIAGLGAPRDPIAGPVFYAPHDGMGAIVDRLVTHLTDVRCSTVVRGIEPGAGEWHVVTESERATVDAVVVTTPAPVTAWLVAGIAPAAAEMLGAIEYASVVLVTLAYDEGDIGASLDGSGVLVPRGEGLLLTACSWASSKWSHLGGDGTVLLRASAGRAGDERALALGDDELVAALGADLSLTMGVTAPPRQVRISRWPNSFPQYAPGHLDRADAIDADLARAAPGVAVAGAFLRGLGIPACIDQGRAAARRVIE